MQHNSLPNSPNEMELGGHRRTGGKSGSNSTSTSPISTNKRDHAPLQHPAATDSYNYVRTSRSEVIV